MKKIIFLMAIACVFIDPLFSQQDESVKADTLLKSKMFFEKNIPCYHLQFPCYLEYSLSGKKAFKPLFFLNDRTYFFFREKDKPMEMKYYANGLIAKFNIPDNSNM